MPDEDEPLTLAEETRTPHGRWWRRAGVALVAILVIVGAGYAAYAWTQRQYFVGEDGGYVTVYRGVNQNLGPIQLASLVERSDVLVGDLPATYQSSLRSTIAVADQDEARARLQALSAAAAECRVQRATGQPCTTGSTSVAPAAPSASTTTPTPIPIARTQTLAVPPASGAAP